MAESLEHYGIEPDPLKILGRYTQLAPPHAWSAGDYLALLQNTADSIHAHARQAALLTLRRANFPENMEGNLFSLGYLWAEMVTRHYTELAALAVSAQVLIDREQTARLYRQVCFFYHDLWYYNLHQRILDTGRIPREQISGYVEEFKQATMETCLIHENVPIRPEDMSIFRQPEEQQEDYDFYTHGKLARPHYEENYAKVLGSIDVEIDGTTRETTSRLHFRTCQILDLSHRMSAYEMRLWWLTQFELVHENIGTIITKVVPVP